MNIKRNKKDVAQIEADFATEKNADVAKQFWS